MVKLYDKNLTHKDIEYLEAGDVIVYPSNISKEDNYLIISKIDLEKGIFEGQLAARSGVNNISLTDIVEACDLN